MVARINPDGVDVRIPWGDMEVNHSVFVPCINIRLGKSQIGRAAKERSFGVVIQRSISDGVLGLRVWRTK